MLADAPGIALHSFTVGTFVYFASILLLIALAAAYVREAIARRLSVRAATRRFGDASPLDAAKDRVVELVGVVETEPAGIEAMRVTLRQEGSSISVGKAKWCDWKERERTVDAVPFTLVLASGARVPVLPGPHPQLLAYADVVTTAVHQRVLSATLRHGERARIRGVIASAPYRESGRGEAEGALQAPAGQRLRVEAESAARQRDLSAGASRRAASRWLLGLAAPIVGSVWWHTELLLGSKTVAASVVSAMTCSSSYKGKTSHYACFTAVSSDPNATFERVPGHDAVGDRVTISFALRDPSFFTKGDTLDPASLAFALMVTFGIAVAILGLVRFVMVRDEKRWFDAEPFDCQEPDSD